MSKKINKLGWVLVGIFLLALSAIGIWKTIYISADIDESYTVTMACRLVKGDRLFLDMWELHQTSAVLYAPFVWIFTKVTGSTIGLLVFLRVVGVCIQGLLAVFVYQALKKYMGKKVAFFLAILFFNFTPKHIQSPEYTLLCCLGFVLTSMSFLMLYKEKKRKTEIFYLVLAALGLCMTVLSYPAALFQLLPSLAALAYVTKLKGNMQEEQGGLIKKRIMKNMAIFTGICALSAVLFFMYVLSGISFSGLFKTLSYVFMDESHKQVMSEHIRSHAQYLLDMLKVTVLAILLAYLGRVLWKKWKKKETFLFDIVLLLVQTVYALIQFHTIKEVNFLIFFPVILQIFVLGIYFYLTYEKNREDKVLFYVMIVPNFCLVVAVLLSSNLTANYSMSFLFPGTLAGLYMIGRAFFRNKKGKLMLYTCRGAVVTLAAVFGLMVFVSRIFLVRYTATQRLNVFEPSYEAWHGVLSGIRLGDTDYRQYEWKTTSLHQHVTKDDVFLYVGADMFLYGETEAKIGTGNTISTPAFGEQLLAYYEIFPERIPTVIFLDCEYTMDYRVWLEEEPFGSFIEEYYEAPIVEGPLYIYKLKHNKE